jgi:hypothetical protein
MPTSQKPVGREPTDEEIKSALKKTKWGKTFTTDFLQKADDNTRITYRNLPGYFEMLEGVGDIFMTASNVIGYSNLSNYVTLLLLQRACGNYFSSVRLSSSGQLPESYVLLRACVEDGLYAFNVYSEPKSAQIWLDRHENEQSRKDSKKLFQLKVLQDNLIQANQQLGRNIQSDYEWCIDYGAHPNERAITTNLSFTGKKMFLELLNTTEGVFQMCLSMCVTCGLDVIKVFNLIYPDDFKKFNAEQRVDSIHSQFKRIAPEISYKLRTQKP